MPSFADFLYQGRIISMTANPRNGKTRSMVDMIFDLEQRGVPCYPDWHVEGINCDKIIPDQLPIDYPDDPKYISDFKDIHTKEFPKGAVLFLDELIKEFDNRMSVGHGKSETRLRAELTQEFMQIGKKHLRVVHAEQIVKTIDWRIAYLSEMFLTPRPIARKLIDNEVYNVAFEMIPVMNEGLFGFRELKHLIMPEDRFWLYADKYDSDEPVMSAKEKEEILESRKKEKESRELKERQEKNKARHASKEAKAQLKSISDKEKLRALAAEKPLQDYPQTTSDDQAGPEKPDIGSTLISGVSGPASKVSSDPHSYYSPNNQEIGLLKRYATDYADLIPYWPRNSVYDRSYYVSERQFVSNYLLNPLILPPKRNFVDFIYGV